MKLNSFAVLPAALALSFAFAPMAFAGPEGDHSKNGGGHTKNGGGHSKNGGGHHGGKTHHGGGSSGNDREVLCRLDNRVVYTRSLKECRDLEFQLGYRHKPYVSVRARAQVSISGGYSYGGGYVTGGGCNCYEQQPVVRYVAKPSRAARMQAEKRARKAAAAGYGYAAGGYGYGSGGMVGYGNGIMVGGYGNNVMVNGNVYGGGYGYDVSGQVVVSKKRKGKKHRRMVVQPGYVMHPGYVYGGPAMVKGGGY